MLEISETTGNPVVSLDDYNNGVLPDPSRLHLELEGLATQDYIQEGSQSNSSSQREDVSLSSVDYRHQLCY